MHWEFSFTPTEQEQRQALCRPQLCQPRTAGGAWRGTWWLAGALLAVLLLVLREIESAAIGRPGVFLLLGAFALPWLAALRWGRSASRAMLAADPAYRQGLRRLRFDDHGICLTWSLGELRLDWNAVTGLESRGEFYLLHAGTQRLLVPRRVFQHEDECRAWLDFVRCRLIKSPPPARAGWRLELPARVLLATWLSVAANLRAGIRLALFGRLSATALRPLPQALLGLIVVWLALHGLADFAEVGPAGRFSPTGLAELLYPLGLMLPAALAAVAISRKAESLLPALTVLLATVTPIAAVNLGLGQLTRQTLEPPVDPAIYPEFLFPFWFTLAAAVGLGRLYRLGPWRGMALSALMTGLLGLPLVLAPRENLVWVSQPSTGDYDSKYDALTAEDAFYQQPRLLARALDGLKPQRSGLTDLYFIGVGGDAEQSVFLKEVRAVEALMARRFGTDGRSIALVNSYRAAMDYPLASVTALRQSLQRVGELMDKNEDILFLFLTSHGSREHEFVLDFWPLRFKPLTPPVLRQLLDEAGIRWRVVVVSACYSGGYSEPLKDEHTVVITAAASDKTSFGCSDENDWTYFGRAFFQEALRDDGDLEQAFQLARRTIAQREEEEEVDAPSDPQIAAGSAMLAKWRSFLAQRAAPAVSVETPAGFDQRLVERLGIEQDLPALRGECRRQMEGMSPVKILDKRPGYFGGLTPKSPLWQELVVAWESYVERYCHLADRSEFLALYAQAWRDRVPGRELDRLDAWLAEPASRSFVDTQRQVERQFRRRLDEAQQPLTEAAQDDYHKTVRELVEAFRRSRSTDSGSASAGTGRSEP